MITDGCSIKAAQLSSNDLWAWSATFPLGLFRPDRVNHYGSTTLKLTQLPRGSVNKRTALKLANSAAVFLSGNTFLSASIYRGDVTEVLT